MGSRPVAGRASSTTVNVTNSTAATSPGDTTAQAHTANPSRASTNSGPTHRCRAPTEASTAVTDRGPHAATTSIAQTSGAASCPSRRPNKAAGTTTSTTRSIHAAAANARFTRAGWGGSWA